MTVRIVAGLAITLAGLLAAPWLVLPVAVLHALAWFGLELILIGAAFDAYFGAGHGVPYYTIAAIGLVVVAEWLKPRLSFYS